MLTLNPKREACKRHELVASGVILDKLQACQQPASVLPFGINGTYAASIPPAASPILDGPRRLPFPRPLKAHRGAAAGTEVPYELDIGVLV